MHGRIPRYSRGFVLVATLWFLVIITIAATYFATRVNHAVDAARQLHQRAQASIDLAGTRTEILFLLASSGFSVQGLGTDPATAIALDDRPYQSSGEDIVSLQDDRGLLNLNFPDRRLLQRMLTRYGVPPEKHPALMDALADYTDEDNLRRLNGAEASDYIEAGLPPPPNEWMTTPYQLQSVYGWGRLDALWMDNRFMSELTVARVSGFNPHTAPRDILLGILGEGSAAAIDEMISLRRTNSLLAREKALALMSLTGQDPESVIAFPSNSLRITQRSKELPWALQYNVTLTPNDETAPWQLDYFSKVPLKSENSNEEAIPRLPVPPAEVAPHEKEG